MDDRSELRCSRCKEFKPPEHFSWRRRARGQRDSLCKPCRSKYGKEHYAANRQRYIDQAQVQKRELTRLRAIYLIEFFRSNPCTDCGESDPVVLEFDHLREKAFNIGTELVHRKWQTILDEIAKCEVVCANCHRRRTAVRRGSMRAMLTQVDSTSKGEAGDRT